MLCVVSGFEYSIKLEEGALSVIHKVRPVPLSIREDLKTILAKLRQESITAQINASKWVSPIVLTKKRRGDLRLCVDLRSLNQNIVVYCHPLPHIQEMLANIGSSKFFIIDLHSAYHQIQLSEESQSLNAFVTPFAAFKFLRLPFGLA